MRVRTIPAVLAAVLTLSACGGGSQPPAAGATPAAAVERLRLRALAVAASAVAPAEAARQLMDFGEAQFPQYFPGRWRASSRRWTPGPGRPESATAATT